ncbi:amino acid synthesis family protein [Thermomicrobium sp.]|uniref:amino acid synthesis family protein n=1 Tax=Thermomicrobium sp. TaxID=1969469 RepID=UPI001B0606FD|nr:amino acid synthesis family protein [Thermomicrobium sp.]MBO9308094.1 amino acid synthesis family protein [Thermomicrobium sp.]
MSANHLPIRKLYTLVDETHTVLGERDPDGYLRKVVCCAVIKNPYAGHPLAHDLSLLVTPSSELGTLLGRLAAEALGQPVESYGKAAIVGLAGEQEHAVACITSTFGNAFRTAIGGGKAWIPSNTKLGAPGTSIDIPLAFKDELWVRSHYDTVEVRIPDAPLPDEIVVAVAVANRGRLFHRLGGLSKAEALQRTTEK